MSLLDQIKKESQKSGASKGKFIYFRADEKKRVRFLTDVEDGMEIVFHDSFDRGINVPCQEIFGKSCPLCGDDTLRTRSLYAWTVYDYEANEVKILMQAVNNCTAVPNLIAMYDTYGTLKDRDYVIQKTGKQQSTNYTVIPMDKEKFRNSKVKPLSSKSILKYLEKAWPADDTDENDEDGFEAEESKYEEMSAKELYKLCKERELEAEPRKTKPFYIGILEEDDKAHDDWDEEDDAPADEEEDDWDDEEDDE
ncbi:hypothetical protein [Clostridium sp.]|uniref:hypothetical protein n=1 Tax=Clostridium sp. TaxID=1506 RepID=UPI001A449CC5|nr:hypothetical protein [Clostridium sp.]MBK5234068.1 hypothetical protein [Clostridium sp.]